MKAVVPWKPLLDLIEPYCPKASPRGGRPAYRLETMLRLHLMQQWYDLSDPAMEDALIEVPTMRRFAGIDLISDRIPDETTILTFRHLLEKHNLGEQIFQTVKAHLNANGMAMKQGTIIDATLIAAPSSTKNRKGERDPEMHQTKKGNQWYFGMKVHIGVDKDMGLPPGLIQTLNVGWAVADAAPLPAAPLRNQLPPQGRTPLASVSAVRHAQPFEVGSARPEVAR